MFLRTVFGCLLAAATVMASGCVAMHPMACGVGTVGVGCGVDCGGCGACAPVGSCGGRVVSHLNSALTCGSGCGEVYYGEWINHPPKYDACDCDGNWTGASACGARCWNPFAGLRNLWGYRYASAGYDSGCSSCMSGMSGDLDYETMELVPEPLDGGSDLQAPPIPEPAVDQPNESANNRQANRRPMRSGQVSHATYRQSR